MTDTSSASGPFKTPALSLAHLQVAQAQMALDRYDFGAPVRVTERGFMAYADGVTAEIEFQNERGEFLGGPKGGFLVYFKPGSYDVDEARAMVNGRQVGHMPGAELSEFESRLDEGVDMLDMDGIALVEDWLKARKRARGYLLGTRLGDTRSIHVGEIKHPMTDAENAIKEAIREGFGGVSVLIEGQRADRLQASVAEWKKTLKAVSDITKSVRF